MFNNKEDLKEWIINYINTKGKRSLHIAINNSKYIKNFILEQTSYLPNSAKYNQRCFHIINDLYEVPLCKNCNINYVNFNNRNKDWRYLDYCSSKCTFNKKTNYSYRQTSLDKWGVDNYSKTKEFRDRMIKINNIKWGVDWYQQSEEFKIKSIKTCLEKYGFTSYTKTEEFKNRLRETFLKNWGVDWYTKSNDFLNKFRNTCLEKYGTEHYMLNDDFSLSVKKQFKDYKLPSNSIVRIQGYEKFALDILVKNHNEEDIIISNKEIREEIGILNYIMDNKHKTYIPDIYIKSENKIIEVKSKWTYELELNKNILKKESCESIGINFEFWIFNKKGELIIK
jgi:hypothetical protein